MAFSSSFMHFKVSFATRQKVLHFVNLSLPFLLLCGADESISNWSRWRWFHSDVPDALSNLYCVCVWSCPDVRHAKQWLGFRNTWKDFLCWWLLLGLFIYLVIFTHSFNCHLTDTSSFDQRVNFRAQSQQKPLLSAVLIRLYPQYWRWQVFIDRNCFYSGF